MNEQLLAYQVGAAALLALVFVINHRLRAIERAIRETKR